MKVLFLTENKSVLEENNPAQAKILEYASLVETFFVVVPGDFEKKPVYPKEVGNIWMYKTNSRYKLLRAYDIFELVSFEIKSQGTLQAEIVVAEGSFSSALAGFLISRKFKRPFYIFLSEHFEKILFEPFSIKNFLLSKIIWFFLVNSNYIKVDNYLTKERLRRKLQLKNHNIQVIKPFFGLNANSMRAGLSTKQNAFEPNFIQKKFPEFKFIAVAFVDNAEQVKLGLSILKKLNKHFPPTSLILITSYNLKASKVNRLIEFYLKSFVRVEAVDEDLNEYLANSNVFFGISEGEKYDEILSRTCALGTTVISLDSSISRSLIEDGTTGFICESSLKAEIVDYFVAKTLFVMENPSSSVSFKLNLALSFKEHVNNTKKEYLDKLKASWRECIEAYKKSEEKFYKL